MNESQTNLPPDDNRQPQDSTSRRGFVRRAWIIGIIIFFGGQLALLLRYFLKADAPAVRRGPTDIGPISQFAPDSVTHFWKEGFLLVRRHSEIIALSHQCTHNKCNVDYEAEQKVISCPCHGALFDLTGAVLRGPARRPLRQYPVTLQEQRVTVELPGISSKI